MKYIYLVLGIIVFLSGFYFLYLVVYPTGYSLNKMNLIGGVLFIILGCLLFIKIIRGKRNDIL